MFNATVAQTLCQQASHVLRLMNENHVNPKKLDDHFIVAVNNEFFANLDPLGLYFTLEDLKRDSVSVSLSVLQNKGPCPWPKSVSSFYKKKLIDTEKIISSYLAKPLPFNEEDFRVRLSGENVFSKDGAELTKKRKRWLSLEILTVMYESAKAKGASKIDSKLLMSFEQSARNEVREKELKKIREVLKADNGIEQDVNESLLKAITKVFDPHSDFFSNSEMKSFEEGISTTESSFGFEVTRNTSDEVVIFRVVPGSAAWNSNEVHVGDIVLQVKKPKGDFSDIKDFDDPSALLKTWDENELELKLKKVDGRIIAVKLYKEKIESSENRVQGFVLSGTTKVGYIALPSFYREWDDDKTTGGCADDLAKEIIKLKKEGIAGLILDLRYNGGGSVGEAVDLVGLFIDIGPVSLIRLQQQLITLKDINRGSVYDGPLLLMVNGASASASEFAAAALQDYNRAIIVGTPTYGKGTGQRIFPSDTVKREFLKITNGKLYRITGKSNQRKGVQPDIYLPDLTEGLVLKERHQRHFLKEDSVIKKVYYTPAPKFDYTSMKHSSENRIQQNLYFKKLDSITQFYRSPIPLKVESFLAYQLRAEQIGKMLDNTTFTTRFKATHNQFDNSLLTVDSFRKNLSDELLVKISQSPFIDESYAIIAEYINQIKKSK